MILKKKKDTPRSPRLGSGYRRSQLTNYYRSKAEINTPSPFKRKPVGPNTRRILFGAADLLLIILILFGLVFSLLLNGRPKVQANNFDYHSIGTYSSQITPLFHGVTSRNKVSFNENAVAGAIQSKFPEVQSVKIELPFFSEQPTVWLDISQPAFKLASGGQVYIVDQQGKAVAFASQIAGSNSLITLSDQSGFQAGLGKQVLSSEGVNFINTVIAQARHAAVPISQLTFPPLAQELDLRTKDQPYYVKFYLGGDALVQTGQFLAARQKFSQDNNIPSQYLDVRVSGKVFYK